MLPCFVFGRDAYLVPFGSHDFFVPLSHDEYWGVVSRTREAYDKVFPELGDFYPFESPNMRRRFCQWAGDGGPSNLGIWFLKGAVLAPDLAVNSVLIANYRKAFLSISDLLQTATVAPKSKSTL